MALNKKQYIAFENWMVKNKLLKENLSLKHYAVDLRLRKGLGNAPKDDTIVDTLSTRFTPAIIIRT
jgi:hypothetical protein